VYRDASALFGAIGGFTDSALQERPGPIGKKGATYAAFFRGVTNVWGVSLWIAADG
jgi:hypothetical protein